MGVSFELIWGSDQKDVKKENILAFLLTSSLSSGLSSTRVGFLWSIESES
jgi:hypothetical protein